MDDPTPEEPWNNYLPALDSAALKIEQAILATVIGLRWTVEQRQRSLWLLEQTRAMWIQQTNPNAALDELHSLCWDSPVESLSLVRANLELIRSWSQEIVADTAVPKIEPTV